ncbi:MAG: outer membrane beta-barrel protein [Muribaculaceae bacterium]|nr:outer membrane beta-barrel protein [Muribaculaceae bacterium]
MTHCRRITLATKGARAIIAMCLLATFAYGATAQSAPYKFDAGAQIGISGYIGEANGSNIFKHPGFDGELSLRYIADTRWAIRGVLSTFGLSGNTSEVNNVLPGNASYSFTSQILDLSVRGEFNFFAYGIGETYKRLRRWTPYLTLGVGAGLALTGGKVYAAPIIPMGLGVKYKIATRWNIGAEFTMTKSFSDHFDGANLADLNLIKTAFYKNTDWYSRLTIGVSYEFGERCETCHYVD